MFNLPLSLILVSSYLLLAVPVLWVISYPIQRFLIWWPSNLAAEGFPRVRWYGGRLIVWWMMCMPVIFYYFWARPASVTTLGAVPGASTIIFWTSSSRLSHRAWAHLSMHNFWNFFLKPRFCYWSYTTTSQQVFCASHLFVDSSEPSSDSCLRQPSSN